MSESGSLLRRYRERKGWSQERLGEAAGGYDRVSIHRYETGAREAPQDLLVAASSELDAPELLLAANAGPFAGVAFNDDLATALDWFEEEYPEAYEGMSRIAAMGRKGEAPRLDDAVQVIDLLTALENVLLAMGRSGVDLVAAHDRHQQKLKRYINPPLKAA